MAHLGAIAFSQISGEVVQTTAWVLSNNHIEHYQPVFFRLIDGNEEEKREALLKQENRFDVIQQSNFFKIPSGPIAYWINENVLELFFATNKLDETMFSDGPCKSGNDDKYLRNIWEVSKDNIGKNNLWRPCSKGGEYRKYYGNIEHLLRWSEADRIHYRKDNIARITPEVTQDKVGITWSIISSNNGKSFRLLEANSLFNSVSPSIFGKQSEKEVKRVLSFLNSTVSDYLLNLMNPTLALNVGNVLSLPDKKFLSNDADKLLQISKDNWDSSETSIGYKNNSLLNYYGLSLEDPENDNSPDKTGSLIDGIAGVFADWKQQNCNIIIEMRCLEQENNRLFIDAYGLQDELTPDVPLEQVTLTINPKYRYGGKLSDEALDNRFQSDTLAEFISYVIGCMMGRYSLDQEGLVYAHAANEGFAELVQQGAYKTFPADDDGIVPLTDQEWFADDATHRFREFVRVVWGEDNLQQNLDFIAESLCLYAIKPKSSESSLDTIRRYLSTKFYKDHLKTYKKRPIYWLFSSGKQKAFECLVYLHRYNESTLSRMRTEYVTPLLGKYEASAIVLDKQIQDARSTAESNRFKKSLTALEKKQTELSEFDDKLKHYADMRISLDLDDGVKVNYGKFGDLLADVKAITGKK